MRRAVIATRWLTPHPNPSASLQVFPCPEGEGLERARLRDGDSASPLALLPREKGGDEGLQALMKSRARSLRRKSTDAEVVLWQHLRNRRLLGCKFRRQVPIGKYIVDFLCEDPPIIIELDGGQHMEQERYDQTRTNWLQANGFLVLRFWNNDIAENLEGVLESLFSTIEKSRPAITP